MATLNPTRHPGLESEVDERMDLTTTQPQAAAEQQVRNEAIRNIAIIVDIDADGDHGKTTRVDAGLRRPPQIFIFARFVLCYTAGVFEEVGVRETIQPDHVLPAQLTPSNST